MAQQTVRIGLWIWMVFQAALCMAQQVGVNTQNPDPSAMLEVVSTTSGMLPPRMSEAQMNAIASPAEALMVYCLDCSPKGFYYFDGSSWVQFSAPSGGGGGGGGGTATNAFIADCANDGFGGVASENTAITNFNYYIDIVNGADAQTMTFAVGDLSLSGVGGMLVTSVDITSYSFAPGERVTITYTISGTPTSSGTLTADWSLNTESCTQDFAVNDDAIRAALSTSLAAYDAASPNSPVEITQAEYNNIANNVPNAGYNGIVGNPSPVGNFGPASFTMNGSRPSFTVLPNNSYVTAVKVTNGSGSSGSFAIGVAGSHTGGVNCLTNFGSSLSGWSVNAFRYFAIKAPTNNSGSSNFLAITFSGNLTGNYIVDSGSPTRYSNNRTCGTGNPTSHPYPAYFQVVSTTTRAW